jgi:hypothetical protein
MLAQCCLPSLALLCLQLLLLLLLCTKKGGYSQ